MIKMILKNIVHFTISVICMSIIIKNTVPGGYWPSAISLLILSVDYFTWGSAHNLGNRRYAWGLDP